MPTIRSRPPGWKNKHFTRLKARQARAKASNALHQRSAQCVNPVTKQRSHPAQIALNARGVRPSKPATAARKFVEDRAQHGDR